MSTIAAGTTSGTALVSTGDTTGALVFKTGASATTAMTIGADQSVTFAGAVNGVAGSSTFTTTGAVSAAGLPVALNTNGTVSTVANIAGASVSNTVGGTPATSGSPDFNILYNSTSNVYLATWTNGGSFYVVAGTLSGTTFTWGSAVAITSASAYVSACWDSINNAFVVVYMAGGVTLARVISVSGTVCTLNAAVTISSDTNTAATALVYDSVSGSMVAFRCSTTSTVPLWYAHGGTVSGGTSTTWDTTGNQVFSGFGAQANPTSYPNGYQALAVNGAIVFTGFNSSGSTLNYQPLTVSGTATSLGTPTSLSVVSGTSNTALTTIYHPVYGVWVSAYINGSTSTLYTTLYTVSNNTINFLYGTSTTTWTSQVTSISTTTGISSVYDSTANRIVIQLRLGSQIKIAVGQISTQVFTSLSFPASAITTVYASSAPNVWQNNMVYSSGAGKVIALVPQFSSALYSFVVTTPYSSVGNFIGVSTASASGGASLALTTAGGVNTNVTGLTTGSNYYASTTGTLTTNPTGSLLIGRALSATALLVTQGTQT